MSRQVVLGIVLVLLSAYIFQPVAPFASFGAGSNVEGDVVLGPSSPPPVLLNKTYDGPAPLASTNEFAQSIIQTEDGGLAMAGYTSHGDDFYLVKTNSTGDLEWSKRYGGIEVEWAYAVVQTVDGGYALAGPTQSFDPWYQNDFWLVKTDSNGTTQWSQAYGGGYHCEPYAMVQTADGGYALAGWIDSYGAGSYDFWLVKTDASGTELWNQTYGGGNADEAWAMIQTADGGFAIAGRTQSFDAHPHYGDIWLVKTNATGTTQWSKTYGTVADSERCTSLVQTVDGGYALSGQTWDEDFWLVKTDASGTLLWNQTYGGGDLDRAESVIQTADGGYALAGWTQSFGAGNDDFWVVRTDASGTLLWNQTYGGTAGDSAASLVQTDDGGLAVVGMTGSFASDASDFWLIKLGGQLLTPTLSAWGFLTPMIDGRIAARRTVSILGSWAEITLPGEWEDADTVNFTLTLGGSILNATLYVKNDHTNLYVALAVQGDEYNDLDRLLLRFDNNDDAARAVGDNALSLSGAGMFADLHVANASTGELRGDQVVNGTRDGVGGVCFSSPTDVYGFELVVPLNSSNDDHDYSLSVGDTVGFNVEFSDAASGLSATWPSPSWSAMAHLNLTGPPVTPPPSTADLRVAGIEVTQAIQTLSNRLPLAQGKSTIARVTVDIGNASGPIDASVHLYGVDSEGKTIGALTTSFPAPESVDRANATHTANFLLPTRWVDRDVLGFKAFVKPTTAEQSESDHHNNWMMHSGSPQLTLSLNRTRTLNIYVAPINIGTVLTPIIPTEREILEQQEYLLAIYPAADVNFITIPLFMHRPWNGSALPQDEALADLKAKLNNYADALGISSPDQLFGVLPNSSSVRGGSSNPPWLGGLGIVAAGTWHGSTSLEGVMAHEIIHNLGPGTGRRGWGLHTFNDLDWPYIDNNINEVGATAAWGWPLIILPRDTPDIMSYDQSGTFPTKWISPYRWEGLFELLDLGQTGSSTLSESARQTGEHVTISGSVTQNGTGTLDPIFRLPGEKQSPSTPGNYTLVIKDSKGTTLQTHSFNVSFMDVEGEPENPQHFTVFLPYHNETAQVILTHNNVTVLDSITVTANAPTVTVTTPNGGESWSSGLQTVQWTGQDLDGDTLTYRLYHSPDNGTTWWPLSPDLTDTSYQLDPALLPGSDFALIRVTASDGFNIGHDESDAVFTITRKQPAARILRPDDDARYSLGAVTLLQGFGSDVDDVVLQDGAYNWTSSIDGYLGNSSTLTAQLSPGTHQITFTVTDSDANRATDTIHITIALDIAISSLACSRANVGQGYPTNITVTLQNRGLTTMTLNVTFTGENSTHQFTINQLASTLTLSAGSTEALTMTWNTTSITKGNYTITVTAWSIAEGTATTNVASTTTVLVTLPGDFDGDRDVDIFDIVTMAGGYGSKREDPNYDPTSDIDYDGDIDIFDVVIAAGHYGDSW